MTTSFAGWVHYFLPMKYSLFLCFSTLPTVFPDLLNISTKTRLSSTLIVFYCVGILFRVQMFFCFLFQLSTSKGLHRIFFLSLFGAISLYMRFLVMGNSLPDFSPADNPAANESNGITRALTFLYLPFYNFWLLLYPANLSYDYSTTNLPLVEDIFSVEMFLSVALYTLLLSCGVFYLYYFGKYDCHPEPVEIDIKNQKLKHKQQQLYQLNHKQHQLRHRTTIDKNNNISSLPESTDENTQKTRENRIDQTKQILNAMVFGFAMMILPFLPATNLLFYVGFIVAERILYIPSIGYCFLVTNGIDVLLKKYKSKQKRILCLVAMVLSLFVLKTFKRNYVWENEETLYRLVLCQFAVIFSFFERCWLLL